MLANPARATIALGVLLVGVLVPAGVARADAAGDFLSKTNALRGSRGIAALGSDGRMVAIAQRWASHMASTQTLSHNADLPNEIPPDWQKYGENVGTGPSVDAIQQAFVNSPHHYANLVDPDFAVVGIAVVTDGRGALWVVEDFLLEASAPPPRPQPSPPPPPAPAPISSTPAPEPPAGSVGPPAAPTPAPASPVTTATTTTTTTPPTTTTTTPASLRDVGAQLGGLDARS